MTTTSSIQDLSQMPGHYQDRQARLADLIVHLTGLALALVGGGMLLGLAIGFGHIGRLAAAAIYAAGLVVMLALSTAYNFAPARYQPLLRRFDHAGIFLMIAGCYTPFTTQHLTGSWAIWMTAAVWSVALFGVLAKLFMPGLAKGFWIAVYLALGWLMVIAIQPLFESLGLAPLILMGVGGLLYSVGVGFYTRKTMRFRREIWHGHVVAAAAVHWVAVLLAVIG
jgi:hemolysin III